MAIHWQIPFKSLRAGTLYTVNIYDAAYSGSPVVLRGAAQPFTTEEDDSEDMFTPVRTQTGYIRIVDNGLAADDTTAFNWKDLIPATDLDRPVTLTHVSGGATVVDWQGFIQTQNFSGELYGNPQEREFPVHCVLSAMSTQMVSTTISVANFFKLIHEAFSYVPSPLSVGTFYIQGGTFAYFWLLSQFDWMNLLSVSNGTTEAKYNYLEAMEDMCRFWGFTMRTAGQDIYLCCADDSAVTACLAMTMADIQAAAGGSTSEGTVTSSFLQQAAIGTDFTTTDLDDTHIMAQKEAVVIADINADKIEIDTSTSDFKDALDDSASWYWQGDGDMRQGYYYTAPKLSLETDVMKLTCVSGKAELTHAIFYEDYEQESGSDCSVIHIKATSDFSTPYCSLESVRSHNFGVGSIEMGCDIYIDGFKQGYMKAERGMWIRLGIGETRQTARWWYIKSAVTSGTETFDGQWSTAGTLANFMAYPAGSKLGCGVMYFMSIRAFFAIPTVAGLRGKIFVDFLGCLSFSSIGEDFMIGNFKLEYSRDEAQIPNTWVSPLPARKITKNREGSHEYNHVNSGVGGDEWSTDTIYGSDNNSDYGYGLLMDHTGAWLTGVTYASGEDPERPEQHLADRVAAYLARSRRRMSLGITLPVSVTPRSYTTIDGTTAYPVAINRNWRDDDTRLTLQEI